MGVGLTTFQFDMDIQTIGEGYIAVVRRAIRPPIVGAAEWNPMNGVVPTLL
jgi:hypothetical protein